MLTADRDAPKIDLNSPFLVIFTVHVKNRAYFTILGFLCGSDKLSITPMPKSS